MHAFDVSVNYVFFIDVEYSHFHVNMLTIRIWLVN